MDNSRISRHLGQTSEYKSTYDSTLIVPEPRQNNRDHLNITGDDLPFVGYDTWNAYEVSGLLDNGLPFAGVMKIVYSSASEFIVESKSLKLYLNSFNSEKLGSYAKEAANKLTRIVEKDLSKALRTDVHVCLILNSDLLSVATQASPDQLPLGSKQVEYKTVEDIYHATLTDIDTYTETPALLDPVANPELWNVFDSQHSSKVHMWHSGLLKSNCRVTSQPDWGDVYIGIGYENEDSEKITPASLLRYIVSFRDECHFHEEICETIFTRLLERFKPAELVVTCLYARRGGIDINPTRATSRDILPVQLGTPSIPHIKTPKQ